MILYASILFITTIKEKHKYEETLQQLREDSMFTDTSQIEA